MIRYFLITLIFLSMGCSEKKTIKIGIQPFDKFDTYLIDTVAKSIKDVYGFEVFVLPDKPIPENTFTNVKSPRYRADSLILYLKEIIPDTVNYIVGLTQKDISTTKKGKFGKIKQPENKYGDWGVFGLGYQPGPSCVVSTYRLHCNDKNIFIARVLKVTIHEIGHNLGLKHCKSKNCIMRDAEEKISTIDNVTLKLCDNCQMKLN